MYVSREIWHLTELMGRRTSPVTARTSLTCSSGGGGGNLFTPVCQQ